MHLQTFYVPGIQNKPRADYLTGTNTNRALTITFISIFANTRALNVNVPGKVNDRLSRERGPGRMPKYVLEKYCIVWNLHNE